MEQLKTTRRNRNHTQEICEIGLFAGVIVIMAQLSIPMPMGVPMTMQTFAITLAAVVLGARKGAYATLIYLLLGCVGLPVFAGFTGGIQYLAGPTGGFLLSFPVMAYLIGVAVDYRKKSKLILPVGVTIGTVLNYAAGVLVFCLITGGTLAAGLTACVIPFIPTAILKAVLGTVLGLAIRRRLVMMTA